MDSAYFATLENIVSHTRQVQSNRSDRDKYQAWHNLLEELHILQRKYNIAVEAQNSLRTFNPENNLPPNDNDFPDLYAELQLKLVENIREFHLQIYSSSSALMNFTKVFINERFRRGIRTNSVSGFYSTMQNISQLVQEIEILQESYKFRSFITHPEQSRNYDWFTLTSQVIYYHPSEIPASREVLRKYKRLLRDENRFFSTPPLNGDDFLSPQDITQTFETFSRITKSYLRKFKDDSHYVNRILRNI